LQMLIKARVAAGHRTTGRALLDFVEPRIYSTTLDFSAVEALSATRERLNEKLAAKKRPRNSAIDVKLERGGIRDIEFVVQCLQRLHGGAEPWVRHGGTMLALARLQDKGFLSSAEYGQLAYAGNRSILAIRGPQNQQCGPRLGPARAPPFGRPRSCSSTPRIWSVREFSGTPLHGHRAAGAAGCRWRPRGMHARPVRAQSL